MSESSRQDDFNEWSQHMTQLRNKKEFEKTHNKLEYL